jgi:hypothetical protein
MPDEVILWLGGLGVYVGLLIGTAARMGFIG